MRERFEKFVEMVAFDNPDRVIDHAAWSSCAIGNFADEYGYNYREVVSNLYDQYGSYKTNDTDEWSIMDILNWNGQNNENEKVIVTYGDLNNYLKGIV